jgi:hypothetical protein
LLSFTWIVVRSHSYIMVQLKVGWFERIFWRRLRHIFFLNLVSGVRIIIPSKLYFPSYSFITFLEHIFYVWCTGHIPSMNRACIPYKKIKYKKWSVWVLPYWSFFFWTAKVLLLIKPVFAQDEQRSEKVELQYRGVVYMRNTDEKAKNQT